VDFGRAGAAASQGFVSDLRGRASSSLGLYNVQKLPANFLIDKEGNIVGKDIYGKSLEQKLDELTR